MTSKSSGLGLLQKIARLRPRLKINPRLVAKDCIQQASATASDFTALDIASSEDLDWRVEVPGASFITQGALPTPGWNMLELEIEHDQRSAAACLTLDYGRGFERHHSMFLPVRKGRVAKRICWIPLGVKRMRLEPLADSKGCFSIRRFRFVWLTPRFAYSRMVGRINYADPNFQGAGGEKIRKALHDEAGQEKTSWRRLLFSYYEMTFAKGAPKFSYQLWQEQVEPLREPSPRRVTVAIEQLTATSCFGFMLTSTEPSAEDVEATLRTLIGQRYRQWRLLLTPRQYASPAVKSALQQLEAEQLQLQEHVIIQPADMTVAAWLKQLAENVHFVMFLSPGDKLAINATYHLAARVQAAPQSLLIYADEDRLHGERRVDVNFKPQWNPDFLLSTNYIGRAAAFSTSRLEQFGDWLNEPGQLDIHSLLLNFTHEMKAEQIQHVAFVVLHRPATEEVPYSLAAVKDYLGKHAAQVEINDVKGVGCHVHWHVPKPKPFVSLLIPTRDMLNILKPCVERILTLTDYPSFEVIILDNQSSAPETLAYLRDIEQDSRVRVLRWDYPFNYSAINNFGVRHSKGDVIGLVNNDIEPINPGWLTEMVGQACRSEIGCVGAKLYYPNDTIQHGGVILGLGGVAGHAHRFFPSEDGGFQNRLWLTQNLSAVTAACLVVRRDIFEDVGGLEEEHLPVAYNDVDLCLKVREKGYRNLWTPFARLYHYESVSRGADDSPVKKARAKREVDYFRRRWGKNLAFDPAYNPNLTVSFEDFSLR